VDIQRPLFWHQGLFLQPQHFQLADLYSQSLLTPFSAYLEPHFWGVGTLDIQKTALGNRILDVTSGQFMFPDGTFATFPGNALLEARSFDEGWIEGGKPLTAYIGLKKWNDADSNVTVLPTFKNLYEVTTRFVTLADAEEVKDLHHVGPPAQVKRLHHLLKLFWDREKEQLGDYLLVPVAQLEKVGDEVRLSEQFLPPLLKVTGSDLLFKLVKEIRDQVAARGRQLEQFKRQRGIQTAEFGARDMVYLLALRSLNRYVPLLYHLTEAPQVHPWAAYGVLRQLIGELSSFSEKYNVLGEALEGDRVVPAYDHRNLWECFATAQIVIAQLLDEITAGPEYVIRLVFDGTYYAAELPPAIFDARKRYYLVVRTEADPKQVIHNLTVIAKLSPREHLPILIARALPGIKLEHLPVPPQELPRRVFCVYFQIDHHNDQWLLLEKSRNLALYWDTAPEDLEVEFMVLGRA
jgi:type VI secretion system protein ImpJ